MKILVTGATGLVGINLVHRLINEGHQVRILVRKKSRTWPFQNLILEKCVGDITDAKSVREAVDGCEVVFHAAGYVNISPFIREYAERINVHGTENVIHACIDAKVKRLVHTSSIAAIGYGTKEQPATEESEWNFARMHNPYTDTKRAGEQRVLDAVKGGNLDAVIVNPGYIIGPWDMKPTSGRMILSVVQGKMPFYPIGGISVAPVDAVIDGHIKALSKGECGERYILGGENLSYREIFEIIADIAGVTSTRIPLKPYFTWPIGLTGNLLGKFWPRTFADLNSRVFQIGSIQHYVSSKKAECKLDYHPKTARIAIREAYDWFREYGYI
jgi:dihydroflavonol-4-reductase